MPFKTDPKAWRNGFRDGYAGRAAPPVMAEDAIASYTSGLFEGDVLRTKHRQEFESLLFSGSQVRPIPKDQDFE